MLPCWMPLRAEGDLSRDELRTLVAQVLEDDRKLDVVRTMARVAGDYKNRRPGVENDWVQFGGIDSLELERIGTPTLVINGSADIDVPPVHSEYAAETIPGVESLIMDRAPACASSSIRKPTSHRPERRWRWARGRPLSPGNRSGD
jgi:pimeloyl-ACP methyl ester carboxylesterase